ncbi:hypothetical protein ACFVT2_34695 [Streptomyces sp. NPDC058000]|uniref:hypothetical protein n=1 Tax=Streptomyces sp. NPDC058000 TaxID=3346299 RepID=UPI0036E0561C
MFSYRTVCIPQCSQCDTAVTELDGGGRPVLAESMILAEPLRERLVADGWQLTSGRARNSREAKAPLLGDKLTCPACHSARRRERAAYERRQRAVLDRPRVKTLDLLSGSVPAGR